MSWANPGRAEPLPLLARPVAAVVALVVVFAAFLIEILAGFVVGKAPMAVSVAVLTVPVAVVSGLAITQWWQVRSSGADRAHWAHLVGPAFALFSWLAWPTVPGQFITAGSVSGACASFFDASAACLQRVSEAWHYHNLAWWLTGVLILGAALIARWSRIAAWGAIVISIAGCELAMVYLQAVLQHYHVSG